MSTYLKLFENHTQYETFIGGGGDTPFVRPNVSHCIAENEVHYNPFVDPYNGHAYVDLGLPSGTKWATMNVGATKPEEYGLYFAWGDTQGYTADQVGSGEGKKAFEWADYKFNPSGDGSTMSKYNSTDGKTILDAEDDAAAANWGGSWKMPTEAQCRELFNTEYVTNQRKTVNGVKGRLFTSVSNGNTLFIPAAGFCGVGSVINVGSDGYVWASSLNSSSVGNDAWVVYFLSSGGGVDYHGRYYGYSVRGVVGQN